MENSFQTSFIPKKPVTENTTTASVPLSRSMNFFSVSALVLTIIVGGVAGGLFVYKYYLINQKEVISTSLLRAKDSFEKDTITELETFDKRVSASKKILAGHITLSPLFVLINDITIPSIQYTKFEHQFTDKGLFYVKMTGVARDYKSIATQSDVFNSPKGKYLKSVVFSNLTSARGTAKDKKESIGFNVEFIVDPTLLSYEKNLALEKSAPSNLPTGNVPLETQSMLPAGDPLSLPEISNPLGGGGTLPSSGVVEIVLPSSAKVPQANTATSSNATSTTTKKK